MKKLKKMLLIYWYTYDSEVIEFGDLNFLTGNTASGKSTIIDALQLVLLGDTNGNFFNKAANEKSVRTLKSYLFGENGDDGDTGFRYLRECAFTSYVILEFEDTEKKSSFIAGIVCDCYEDLHFDYKWIIADRMRIPDNRFADERTHVPYTIPLLKAYLKKTVGKSVEFIDTNRRYQEVILGKYGALKRKYMVLLKKAVPFSPIADIEQFITESICDVKNNIHVEQMQSDIRQYKNLEADAIRTQERVAALTGIADASRIYEADKDRALQQNYIILRAGQEELKEGEAKLREKEEKYRETIRSAEENLTLLVQEANVLEEEIAALEEEYHTSDLVKHQKALEKEMADIRERITALAGAVKKAQKQITAYGKNWDQAISEARNAGYEEEDNITELFDLMKQIQDEDLKNFDFAEAAVRMENVRDRIREYAFELHNRAVQIRQTLDELTARIDNLKKGIKPYPAQVTALKRKLESELFSHFKKSIEVPIFAELLEIRNPIWRDAVEGYLDRQKFNLLVPETYYQEAVRIYNEVRREEKIYDAGIVDIAKLRKEFSKKPEKNSLAEEIETDDPDARLYADFLLGNVIKCENVRELSRYRIAITKEVMLYKGYVSRRLNPARYADPFIGRKSLEILLANLTVEKEQAEKEYTVCVNHHRVMQKAAGTEIMSRFEADQYVAAVKQAEEIPMLTERLSVIEREYESLDFTYLDKLKQAIREKKEKRTANAEEQKKENARNVEAVTRLDRLTAEDLPLAVSRLLKAGEEIESGFDPEWIEHTGEPRFQREIRQRAHREKDREGESYTMSLRESFSRARAQTLTIMEGHAKDLRRKRAEYNQEYKMPYDTEREDNTEYDEELHTLSEIKLPDYIEKIRDAREKAYDQFRDDFIAKLKSNIESVKEQLAELNHSLRDSVFGTDRYRFVMNPRAEYRNYYDMITDPMLMDTGGWNIASQNFNEKYQKEIDSLFKALIVNDTEMSAERRAEYEKNIKKFTDYKTYLVFDLIVTNDQGEEQRLSKTLLKKSGGETQIPFYIALLASFSQVCRIRVKGKNNTVRLIILDEAFSKMDGERIQEGIALLRRFGLQAIFSAPPEKISDIAPGVDTNIVVYKSGHHSFTKKFDPQQISAEGTGE